MKSPQRQMIKICCCFKTKDEFEKNSVDKDGKFDTKGKKKSSQFQIFDIAGCLTRRLFLLSQLQRFASVV